MLIYYGELGIMSTYTLFVEQIQDVLQHARYMSSYLFGYPLGVVKYSKPCPVQVGNISLTHAIAHTMPSVHHNGSIHGVGVYGKQVQHSRVIVHCYATWKHTVCTIKTKHAQQALCYAWPWATGWLAACWAPYGRRETQKDNSEHLLP